MQGPARRGSGLCTHRVDQGSAGAAMGCHGGGGSDSGLLWGRRHRWVRARGTRTRVRAQVTRLGAPWRVGHENGGARALAVKWLMAGKLDTGGLKAEEGLEGIWMEMKMSPPP